MTTNEDDDELTFVERMFEQGVTEAKAEAVLRMLDDRKLAPSKEQRQRVMSCTDSTQLDLWFDRAATAVAADEVFAD
jgi:hypothetical protein